MPSFADIQEEIRNVTDSAEFADSDPEAQAEFDAYLDELAAQEAEKADAIAFALRYMASREEALRKLADEINAKARSLKRSQERLRNRCLETMTAYGLQKVKGSAFTLSRRSTTAVQIDDMARIPFDYIEVTTSPIKSEIKRAIQSGQSIPGASLVTTESLMVR